MHNTITKASISTSEISMIFSTKRRCLNSFFFLAFWSRLSPSDCLASKNRKNSLPLRKRPVKDLFVIEQDLQKRGFRFVIGSDESGRGCIAGPVVAASFCVVPNMLSLSLPSSIASSEVYIDGVDDSKVLTKTERDQIYKEVLNRPDTFVWSVVTRSNEQIDETSLEQATQECFQESIENVMEQLRSRLALTEEDTGLKNLFYSIVDGHKSPAKLSITSRPYKSADEIVYSVALASTIARCHHETIMDDLATQYPLYCFEDHGGYPTRGHVEVLHRYGPSSVHRMSTKPVKDREAMM